MYQLWTFHRRRQADSKGALTDAAAAAAAGAPGKRPSKAEQKAREEERKAKAAPRGMYRASTSLEGDAPHAGEAAKKDAKKDSKRPSLADYANFKPLESKMARDSSSCSSSSSSENASSDEDVLSALEKSSAAGNTRGKSKGPKGVGRAEVKDGDDGDDGYGSDGSDGASSVSSKASSVRSDVSSLSAMVYKHGNRASGRRRSAPGQGGSLLRQSSSLSVGGPRTADPDDDGTGSLCGADALDDLVRGFTADFSRSSSLCDLADDEPKVTAAQIRANRRAQGSGLPPVPEGSPAATDGSGTAAESASAAPSPLPPPDGFVPKGVVQSALNELVDLRKKLSAATTGSSSDSAAAANGEKAATTSSARQPETPLERAWDKVLTAAERDPDAWARQMEVLFMSLDWEGNTLIDVAEFSGSLGPHGVAAFKPDEADAFRTDVNPRGHAGTITCTEFAARLKARGALEALAAVQKAEQTKVDAKRHSITDKAVQRRKDKDAALALLKAEAAAEEAVEEAALEAAAANLSAKATEAKAQAAKTAAEAEAQVKLKQQEERTKLEEQKRNDQQKQEEQQQQQQQLAEKQMQQELQKQPEEEAQEEQDQEADAKAEEARMALVAAVSVAADKPLDVGGASPQAPAPEPKPRRSSLAALAALAAPLVEEYHASEEAPGLSLEVREAGGADMTL
jgi:hypothetical protein